MNILSREEMYFLDKYTIEKIGIPGKDLMEKAGLGCSEKIQKDFLNENNHIAFFCGNGNNGGDGFVIARYLKNWKHYPTIFFTGKIEKTSPETLENYNRCVSLNIPINQIATFEDFEKFNIDFSKYDLIVDAIFGVGFRGIVRGWFADLFRFLNDQQIPIVAIDISSGIEADTGRAKNALKAQKTYTMAAYKQGQFLEEGRDRSGKVEIIDIGIPKELFKKFPPKTKLVTEQNVKFPMRKILSHKGDYGRIAIIAGSPGFSGAAVMSSRAALRSGGGLITLFHPKSMELIFETQLLEVMTFAMPEIDSSYDWETIKENLKSKDVLLIGPGLGTSTKAIELFTNIIKFWDKPLVIDADGLNILAENKKLLKLLKGKPVIITPHIGEFSKLAEISKQDILNAQMQHIQMFAKKYEISILLKSSTTIFCDGEKFVLDISGNDGLATGGSGDVLAGIIVSFLGQKLDINNSAISASYLMGKTAEKLALIRKPASIIPSDIIENLFVY
ncbi:MAG: NAD(P)H-hydrate dehydratase [Candidatus Cloacimonetes bacterium]|nr:NAD(P)H-hydrate dehydratase [Candidatus Cloacimonadota bacterium]